MSNNKRLTPKIDHSKFKYCASYTMSHPAAAPHHEENDNNDSDATFCAEIEQKKSRKFRKKAILYQVKSSFGEKMEARIKLAVKRNEPLEEAHKLFTRLERFKPKTKRDQTDVSQLTETLKTFVIGKKQKTGTNQQNQYKNKSLNNTSCEDSGKLSLIPEPFTDSAYNASQELAQNCNDHDTNQVMHQFYYNGFERFDSEINQTVTNLNDEQEFNVYFDYINTNEVSNTNREQFCYDTCEKSSPGTLMYITNGDEQECELNFGSININGALNDVTQQSHCNQHLDTDNVLNLDISQGKSETLNGIDYDYFDSFMEVHSTSSLECHQEDAPQSNSVILKPERQKTQQLMDKYLTLKSSDPTPTLNLASQSLHEVKCSTENNFITQTKLDSKIHETKGAIPKLTKRKTKVNHKRTCEGEAKTQMTLLDFFENIDEEKEKNKPEKTDIFKNVTDLKLKNALEMMETCKRDFLTRLRMRKQEILEARSAALESQSEIQKDDLYLPCCSEKVRVKQSVTTEDRKSEDNEEMLQNLKDLFEISARYKEMYRNQEIDLLSD